MKKISLFLFFIVIPEIGAISNPLLPKILQKVRDIGGVDNKDPFDDDDYDCKPISDMVWPFLGATMTSIYGSTLLLFSHYAPSQLHVMTILRATGQNKIETAVQRATRNYKKARFMILCRAPSLYLARRSIQNMDDRVMHHRTLVAETKKAKEDGVVTPREAKRLKKLQRIEIRNLKRDMRRMLRASISLAHVMEALDLHEITDIGRDFMFQLLAVLATGHNDGRIGSMIGGWCLFVNLGGLILDTNKKLNYPIATRLLQKLNHRKVKPTSEAIKLTGQSIVYGASGYLVFAQHDLSTRLNAALLSSAVALRGLRQFTKTMLAWDNDSDDGPWPAIHDFLEGSSAGMLMVGLTVIGLLARNLIDKGKLKAPNWMTQPLAAIETFIDRLTCTSKTYP